MLGDTDSFLKNIHKPVVSIESEKKKERTSAVFWVLNCGQIGLYGRKRFRLIRRRFGDEEERRAERVMGVQDVPMTQEIVN